MRARSLLLLLGASACDMQAHTAYESARAEVEQRAVAAPTGWVADASLSFALTDLETLSRALLDDVLQRVPNVSAPLVTGLPLLSIRPLLHTEQLSLEPAPDQPGCLRAHGHLAGTVGAQLGGRAIGLPVSVELTAPLCLVVAEGRAVLVQLGEVESARVNVATTRRGRNGAGVEPFLRTLLHEHPPAASLAVMGEEGLPIVAARLAEAGHIVRIDLRTDVPGERPPLVYTPRAQGVAFTMTDRSLTSLVRRAIWAKQASSLTPFLDPTEVDLSDGTFTASVRLWNPGWPVWWQDYRVSGPIKVQENSVRVRVTTVEPGASSSWLARGEMLTEPLQAALATALEGRISRSLPSALDRDIHSVHLGLQLRAVEEVPGGFALTASVATTVDP